MITFDNDTPRKRTRYKFRRFFLPDKIKKRKHSLVISKADTRSRVTELATNFPCDVREGQLCMYNSGIFFFFFLFNVRAVC